MTEMGHFALIAELSGETVPTVFQGMKLNASLFRSPVRHKEDRFSCGSVIRPLR